MPFSAWFDKPLLAGAGIAEIEADGYLKTLRNDPARVLSIACVEYLIHCGLVFVLGWQNWFGWLIERGRRASGITAEDQWVLGLEILRVERGMPATYVRAVMKTGEQYLGYVYSFAINEQEGGGRTIVLQGARYASTRADESNAIDPLDEAGGVALLDSNNIAAIEAIFTDPHANAAS